MTGQQRQILEVLRKDAPLDHYQIAASTARPPFAVRGELSALRRAGLIQEADMPGFLRYELTAVGDRQLDQMELI